MPLGVLNGRAGQGDADDTVQVGRTGEDYGCLGMVVVFQKI